MQGYPIESNLTVMAMNHLVITGNVIPPQWFNHLVYANGKPHQNAAFVLSDTVYWYRPIVIRDEQTGQVLGMRKRFKEDKLQRSYSYFSMYGLSKKQAKEAVDFLIDLGVMAREFRTIDLEDGRSANNVMYLDLVPARLAEITVPDDDDYLMDSLSAFLLSRGAEPPSIPDDGPEDDQGLPDEVTAVLDAWNELLPGKPQPRRIKSNSQIRKLITRLKDKGFQEGWRSAMEKASNSPHLQKSTWFKFEYFCRNNENWQKILDGVFDSFDRQYKQQQEKQNGGPNKHTMLAEIEQLISTYGRRGFPEAEVAATFKLRPIVQEMSDLGWAGVCEMKADNFRIKFFQAYTKIEQEGRIGDLTK